MIKAFTKVIASIRYKILFQIYFRWQYDIADIVINHILIRKYAVLLYFTKILEIKLFRLCIFTDKIFFYCRSQFAHSIFLKLHLLLLQLQFLNIYTIVHMLLMYYSCLVFVSPITNPFVVPLLLVNCQKVNNKCSKWKRSSTLNLT